MKLLSSLVALVAASSVSATFLPTKTCCNKDEECGSTDLLKFPFFGLTKCCDGYTCEALNDGSCKKVCKPIPPPPPTCCQEGAACGTTDDSKYHHQGLTTCCGDKVCLPANDGSCKKTCQTPPPPPPPSCCQEGAACGTTDDSKYHHDGPTTCCGDKVCLPATDGSCKKTCQTPPPPPPPKPTCCESGAECGSYGGSGWNGPKTCCDSKLTCLPNHEKKRMECMSSPPPPPQYCKPKEKCGISSLFSYKDCQSGYSCCKLFAWSDYTCEGCKGLGEKCGGLLYWGPTCCRDGLTCKSGWLGSYCCK